MDNYYNLIKRSLNKLTIINALIKFIDIPINLISATFIANIINGATNSNISYVLKNSSILITIVIFNILINYFFKVNYEIKKNKITNKLKLTLYNKILNRKMSDLYNIKQGELIEILNKDFSSLIEIASVDKPNFYIGIIGIIIYTIFLFTKSSLILITFIILSLVQIIVPIVIKKFLICNYEETWKIESLITENIISTYRGFSLIKCYKLKQWSLNKFKYLSNKYLKVCIKSEGIASLERILYSITDNLLKYGTYLIIGIFILYEKVNLNTAIKCISISFMFFSFVKNIFNIYPKIFISNLIENKIIKYFDIKESVSINYIADKIVFDKVCYSYNDKIILKDACLNIKLDEITIIKGENGIGKSTFFKLIMGLLEVDKGKIYINEKDIFYIPQEDTTFEFSLLELIKLMGYVDLNKFKNISLKFGLAENKIFNEKICNLSGGERKKGFLSIALSLDNKFLLLDEPTNNLDKESKQILKNLLLNRERGSIIIVHNRLFENIKNQYTLIDGGFKKNESL